MIGKIFPKSAGSFKGRIRYIFGCTKHDHEITGIRTIGSNCLSSDPLPGILAGDETGVQEMIREFDSVEAMRSMSIDSDKAIKPVFHAMLSLRPGESLSTSQWRFAVQKYLGDLGFDESTQYVAVMHRDKDHEHVHIVANRIRLNNEFSMVKDSNERSVSLNSVSEIEDRFGLTKAPRPKDTWGVSITQAELQASIRDNDLPLKHKMIAKIAGAIERTQATEGDMFDFVRALRKQKVYINLTLNDEGQPKGICFEFDGKYISGRQLKRSRLTWHKLTTQEGIHYDPQSIHELQVEIAKRDREKQERARFYYYEFSSRGRGKRLYIRYTAKQVEIFKLIEDMLRLLNLFFGDGFEARLMQPASYFVEYSPGRGKQYYEELMSSCSPHL
ncbi:relaxase/mobilization nuclease domain-containing protein [Pseudomonas monteilii]|uniref:relaxase/mobilization nuclease domain-containing protein n=1 Tax=Pseudomonas monteilii TaxID=76759 RepID=UPI0008636A61|nr:relaxase/mobilization nuclease domain-containing protein [Pseudomonas monteilii]